MDWTLIDIGKPKRLIFYFAGLGNYTKFDIETELGLFHYEGDHPWRAYQFGFELVWLNEGKDGMPAWALSEHMALVASIARFEYGAFDPRLKEGDEIPLMSDEEGWRYMLSNNFPWEFREARQILLESPWVDVSGRNVAPPAWLRGYVARLLNHRTIRRTPRLSRQF